LGGNILVRRKEKKNKLAIRPKEASSLNYELRDEASPKVVT